MGRVLVWLAAAGAFWGADQTQAMLARVSEEADAFRRIAPSLLGHETLEQKARKPQPRFRPRVGNNARLPPVTVWQDRQVVSEYGFVNFGRRDRRLCTNCARSSPSTASRRRQEGRGILGQDHLPEGRSA